MTACVRVCTSLLQCVRTRSMDNERWSGRRSRSKSRSSLTHGIGRSSTDVHDGDRRGEDKRKRKKQKRKGQTQRQEQGRKGREEGEREGNDAAERKGKEEDNDKEGEEGDGQES